MVGLPKLLPDPIAPTHNDDEINEELARVTSSSPFRSAPQLKAFLQFVVGRALAGDGAHIKAYTIAVEALGRNPEFDPQIDPIVRVEAGRLRRALDRFYSGEGREDPVVIELPLGSYVPRFHVRANSAASGHTPKRPNANAYLEQASHLEEPDQLAALFRQLIEHRRLQVEALAADIRAVKDLLERSSELLASRAKPRAACRPGSPLLPPRRFETDAAGPANGRQEQQVEGAFAARPRRSRTG